MGQLFSVEGLLDAQECIKNVAAELGFKSQREPHPGIVFLSFRPEAPKIIMVISGTHGVEGPAGYDLQLGLLQKKAHEKLPPDVGLVFVVALNPWGWVNGRRMNENNVDLNRNGWFGLPPELPPLDPEINALVNPEECNEKWHRDLIACLADPAKIASLRAQVFRGQHDNPQGIFYGGRERSWSFTQLELFLRGFLSATCHQLAVLDIHTGLGERGEITLISSAGKENGELIKRCRSWFGLNVVFPNLGQTEIVNAVSSDLLTFLSRYLPETQVTGLAVEIGTDPFATGFPIFVAENWSHHHSGQMAFCAGYDFCDSALVGELFRQYWYPPLVNGVQGPWSAATRAGFGPIFRTAVRGLSI